jgi:hypothetical protein
MRGSEDMSLKNVGSVPLFSAIPKSHLKQSETKAAIEQGIVGYLLQQLYYYLGIIAEST